MQSFHGLLQEAGSLFARRKLLRQISEALPRRVNVPQPCEAAGHSIAIANPATPASSSACADATSSSSRVST